MKERMEIANRLRALLKKKEMERAGRHGGSVEGTIDMLERDLDDDGG